MYIIHDNSPYINSPFWLGIRHLLLYWYLFLFVPITFIYFNFYFFFYFYFLFTFLFFLMLLFVAAADEKILGHSQNMKSSSYSSMQEMTKFNDAVEDIESASFEPKTFKSGRSDKTKVNKNIFCVTAVRGWFFSLFFILIKSSIQSWFLFLCCCYYYFFIITICF